MSRGKRPRGLNLPTGGWEKPVDASAHRCFSNTYVGPAFWPERRPPPMGPWAELGGSSGYTWEKPARTEASLLGFSRESLVSNRGPLCSDLPGAKDAARSSSPGFLSLGRPAGGRFQGVPFSDREGGRFISVSIQRCDRQEL